MAFYPVFPKEPSDNNRHLQALRHFWVFAMEDPVAKETQNKEEKEEKVLAPHSKFNYGLDNLKTK